MFLFLFEVSLFGKQTNANIESLNTLYATFYFENALGCIETNSSGSILGNHRGPATGNLEENRGAARRDRSAGKVHEQIIFD
jgi:hypothetical protein